MGPESKYLVLSLGPILLPKVEGKILSVAVMSAGDRYHTCYFHEDN